MTVWFTADTHFGHTAMLLPGPRWPARPWATVQEHDTALVAAWNARVRPGDRVYHLGDFAMGDRARLPELLAQLHGDLVLVAGNHDFQRDDRYFPRVLRGRAFLLDLGPVTVEVAHRPEHLTAAPSALKLCGHVHTRWATARHPLAPQHDTLGVVCNVGVDVRSYAPVQLEALLLEGAAGTQDHGTGTPAGAV